MKKTFDVFLIVALCVVGSVGLRSADWANAASDGLADPIKQGNVAINLVTVADGLTAPNWGISAPGDNGRLFVTDQHGDAIDPDLWRASPYVVYLETHSTSVGQQAMARQTPSPTASIKCSGRWSVCFRTRVTLFQQLSAQRHFVAN